MGQQQLLLLVLGIVIVGLAVVVGIQAFSENQAKANADAMVNDGVRIASDIQAWALKPEAFGGLGDAAGNFSSVTWNDIGYSSNSSSEYENLNGTYTLDGSCNTSTTPTTPGPATPVYINGQSDSTATANLICVVVSGTQPEHVQTAVEMGGS